MLLLVGAGLVGADLATYSMLRSFFDARVDRQLTRTSDRIDQALARRADAQVVERALRTLAPDRTGVALLDPDGTPIALMPPAGARPAVFDRMADAATLGRLRDRPARPVRVELAGEPYRAVYHPATGRRGTAGPVAGFVVAVSLRADQDALRRLAGAQAVITAVALVTLGGLALAVLRVGLRPLRDMAAVAAAIGAGDGTRRIRADHPGSEAGKLAAALNQAFEERHRAEDRLRRFVADASHELRTPLTTIGGWADLYFHGGLPDRAAVETAMSRIAAETAHMRNLVEELLMLARLDQQRPLDPRPVDLAALVEDVVSDARVIDPGRPITVRADGQHPGALVTGDLERLRQVVRNLVGNALQHTPAGTPVHVAVEAVTGDGDRGTDQVRLTVADEGPGIPAETRSHLFERFYQGDPRRGRGSGLGLAIVRTIVEAHDGTVEVRDTGGRGSEFQVTLPAAATSAGIRTGRPATGP
jgi:two-component system OmpR family sensor kinase